MENGVQALLMGFAILVFIIALTVSFSALEQAKHTADVVLKYSDRTNFQILKSYDPDDYKNGVRKVTKDIVISTIARCIREKFTVYITDKDGTKYNFEYDIKTEKEIKEEIRKFIENCKGKEFKETYVEVTTSGKTYTDDGISLEEDVGKKLYITYEADK